MRPCRVCGNDNPGELNRHHLLPKYIRKQIGWGASQITIKLCRDQHGCQVHRAFHAGDLEAAREIREVLEPWEVYWMATRTSWDWVNEIYPTETYVAGESYSYAPVLSFA